MLDRVTGNATFEANMATFLSEPGPTSSDRQKKPRVCGAFLFVLPTHQSLRRTDHPEQTGRR